MFTGSQRYYDALYSWKDYPGEAEKLHGLIQARNPGAATLLDVACGTGKHLELLRDRYWVEGLDLDPELLAVARARLPGVPLHEADMVDLDVGRRFDVVTCLFSSIGYAGTLERLERAVAAMARHLRPGGVLVVEPWFSPEGFIPGHVAALFLDEPERKIVRMDTPRVRDRTSVIEFHYLVGTPAGVEHFTELHELAMFTHQEYLGAFERAGLQVEHDPDGLMGRGLYIGTR